MGFEYTFTGINKEDEKKFFEIVNSIYKKDHGFSIYENNEQIYNGYHSTIVCKLNGNIIGGTSAYISDPEKNEKLPMEKIGIALNKYFNLESLRYAEMCQSAVFQQYRKYNIFHELMGRMIKFLLSINCAVCFWKTRKYYTLFMRNEVLSFLDYAPKVFDIVEIKKIYNGRQRSITYDLSYIVNDPIIEKKILNAPIQSH